MLNAFIDNNKLYSKLFAENYDNINAIARLTEIAAGHAEESAGLRSAVARLTEDSAEWSEEKAALKAKAEGSAFEFDNDAWQFGIDAWRGAGFGYWQRACLVTMV